MRKKYDKKIAIILKVYINCLWKKHRITGGGNYLEKALVKQIIKGSNSLPRISRIFNIFRRKEAWGEGER